MRSLTPLIKDSLLELNIKVNVMVRQKRRELHILLESTYFGDRELLLENLTKCLSEVDPRRIEAAKIYAAIRK